MVLHGRHDVYPSDMPPMAIFAWRHGNDIEYIHTALRLYSLIIREKDRLAANFIPCYRKSDDEPGMYDTVSKTFYTNSGTGTFLVGDPVNYDTASLLERRRQILLNTPHIETVSDSMASFKTDIATDLKELKVYFSPVQEGTGDPSPDNVRPILGWDGIEISVGKNIFDSSKYTWTSGFTLGRIVSGRTDSCDGTAKSVSGSYCMILDFIPCKHLQGKHISLYPRLSSSAYAGIAFYTDANESSYIASSAFHGGGTVPSNAKYMRLTALNVSNYAHYTIEITDSGSISAVSDYVGITIPFPQTIYGGYVDLLNGEVVEEWEKTTFGDDWTFMSNANRIFGKSMPTRKITTSGSDSELICNKYTTDITRPISQANSMQNKVITARATYNIVMVKDSTYETVDSFETANSDGEFAYKLVTPNTYSLTPETIKAIKGTNNIWSNANGNVEVSFYSH